MVPRPTSLSTTTSPPETHPQIAAYVAEVARRLPAAQRADVREELDRITTQRPCPECHGARVNAAARAAFAPERVYSPALVDQVLQWFVLSTHYRVVSLLPFVLLGVVLALGGTIDERASALLSAKGIKVVPTGIAHGTVTLVAGGRGFEVTTFRRDVQTDGRHAVVAFSDDLAEDASDQDPLEAAYLAKMERRERRAEAERRALAQMPLPIRTEKGVIERAERPSHSRAVYSDEEEEEPEPAVLPTERSTAAEIAQRCLHPDTAMLAIAEARDEETLRQLDIRPDTLVVLGMTHVAASLMTATALNELGVREIWAKAGSRQHVEALTRLGVSRIIQPEREAGLAMASEILRR